MPEVPNVKGANPTPPPPERKETSSPDRFQEHMRKDKVTETDPEEQKKRKRPEEAEAEKKAEETQKKEKSSKKQEAEAEVSLSFSVKTGTPSPASREVPNVETASGKEDVSVEKPVHKKKEAETKKIEEKAPLSPPPEKHPFEPTFSTQAPFASPKPMPKIETPVSKETETKAEEPAMTLAPKEAAAVQRVKVKEKTVALETALSSYSTPTPSVSVEPKATKAYVQFPAQILDMFERMVGVITVLKNSGMRETTIHLTGPQFASSIFNGCQITIQEFSSAPKSFNIQFVGNPQAVQAFEAKIPLINTAFSTGNYDFKVNRLEANLSKTEGPVLHRKKEASGQSWDQDQQGKKQK